MMTTVSICALVALLVIAAVIIAFADRANAAGTNATSVATSAKKSSQIGREYYDSIPKRAKPSQRLNFCHRLCIECFKGLNYTWRQRLLRYAPFAILVALSSFSIIGVLG